jgi:hypothetical protein
MIRAMGEENPVLAKTSSNYALTISIIFSNQSIETEKVPIDSSEMLWFLRKT